ncbi:5499_t:CDS:2, partial [Racocetra fulgida]
MFNVRSSYRCAFKALVAQAMIESHMIVPSGSISGVPENGKTSLVDREEINDLVNEDLVNEDKSDDLVYNLLNFFVLDLTNTAEIEIYTRLEG